MINAGLPLVQSLDILATQQPNKRAAEKIRAVLSDVESGSTLADAMGRHRDFFSEIYVNMVAAGEAGGILDVILLRLAEYLRGLREAAAQGEGRDVLPGDRDGLLGAGDRGAPDLRDPDLRRVLRNGGRPASASDAHRHGPLGLPDLVVVGGGGGPGRDRMAVPRLPEDSGRPADDGQADAPDPDPGSGPPQGGDRPLQPYARHPRPERRADPGRAARSPRARPATGSSRTPS